MSSIERSKCRIAALTYWFAEKDGGSQIITYSKSLNSFKECWGENHLDSPPSPFRYINCTFFIFFLNVGHNINTYMHS
jgi:hypothetical protein